jgi:predicted transcriptional regulator
MSKTLEQRISDALKNDIAAVDLAALITETAAAIDQTAKVEREKALDPMRSPDAKAARAAMDEAEFMCNRLQTMLPRLQARYTDVEAAEARARWEKERDGLEVRRDAAAKRFTKYPALVAELVAIFSECAAIDMEISGLNGRAPSGARNLKSTELVARGIGAFNSTEPSIVKTAVLPDYDHSAQTAWPIREVVDWASIAPVQYHPGADWAAARSDADAVQKQPDAVRREQQRIESYYRDQRRLQEERQRREAEEALAARQRSA